MVPFDDKSPFITSGIRLGTAAITTRGIKDKQIPIIVNLIDKVFSNPYKEQAIVEVKKEVNKLMKDYPLFA